jgi:hypothetical protein
MRISSASLLLWRWLRLRASQCLAHSGDLALDAGLAAALDAAGTGAGSYEVIPGVRIRVLCSWCQQVRSDNSQGCMMATMCIPNRTPRRGDGLIACLGGRGLNFRVLSASCFRLTFLPLESTTDLSSHSWHAFCLSACVQVSFVGRKGSVRRETHLP